MKILRGFWLLLVVAPGCATAPHRTASAPPADSPPPQAIVFVLDGAGDYRGLSTSLRACVYEDRLPLHVHTVEWSHGYRRIFADHIDRSHARRQGQQLAEAILCYQKDSGSALPIFLVAHSAGSHPALVAGEFLPPDSIERIILLEPSVAAQYDIRPALRAARKGVDVFHSRLDYGYLGVGMALFGTADGGRPPVSGRVGFQVPKEANGGALYTRLHQHPWEPSQSVTGHTGGHFTVYQTGFLRTQLRPLLLPN